MKTEVAYLITKSERGGAQAHVADLLAGFNSRFHLRLISGDRGYLTDVAEAQGIETHVLPDLVQPISPLKDTRAVFRLLAILRTFRPDLLHAHSSKAGLLGRTAAKLSGVPAIFTAHGWGFAEGVSWQQKGLAVPSEALANRWGQWTIAVSEADRKLALRYRTAPSQRLTTIHNGVADTPHRAAPARGDVVKIAVVARFAPQKDHYLLLRALAGFTDDHFELVFIGDGPTRLEVERQGAELGLQSRMTFLGTRSDIPELLSESHLFVLPSNWEGLPLSILEAMRAGLPVIASDVGGVREAVVEGETGFLVQRGDVEKLRERLRALLGDASLRARLGAAGRARFEAHFTVKQMLAKTLTIYDEVLSARVAGRCAPESGREAVSLPDARR